MPSATTYHTQSMYIPEIINGTWSRKYITITVPSNCTKCGGKRTSIVYVNNKAYGRISRANCIAGCNELYEDFRKQAEAYKQAGGGFSSPAIYKAKLKFDPWVPDTIVGSGIDDGMNCAGKYCNEYFKYAQSNQPNGTFLCRRCRGII